MSDYQSLVEIGAGLCGDIECAGNIADNLLAQPAGDELYERGGASGLNADGTPLQLCISTRKESWSARFIADPASVIRDPAQRFAKSYQQLERLYKLTRTDELKPFCEAMINSHLPHGRSGLTAYPDGVFWFGAPLTSPGLAVYMDGRRGGNEAAWQRFTAWLKVLMPDNKDITPLCTHLAMHTNMMSIGFEGSNMKNLRAKVYWRLKEPLLLDDLNHPILANDSFKVFLNELAGEREIRLSGLVFSMGFHIISQTVFDAKIDVCACPNCMGQDAAKWQDTLRHFTDKYKLAAFPVIGELVTQKCSVAFFGYGLDIKGGQRLNLYLKAYGNG